MGGSQTDSHEQLGLLAPTLLTVALVVGLVRTRTQQKFVLLLAE
jgi:hypothetical protein